MFIRCHIPKMLCCPPFSFVCRRIKPLPDCAMTPSVVTISTNISGTIFDSRMEILCFLWNRIPDNNGL
ncbi:hypothetical protein EVA_18318 [gut metagenome]|uniref:Uncharacterized protein n=1 Tax=gut metagenome TaxID=749906 RepID=J9C1A3_9ZZZZ